MGARVNERGGEMAAVARYCAGVRGEVLEHIEAAIGAQPALEDLRAPLLDYPLRAAKGLRPALCVAAARALGASRSAALPSAAALELLHNAFLIHDDVEDESLARRGEPTLQRRYGQATAMNMGDAMLALALGPLLDNTAVIGLGPALEVLDLVRETVVVTAAGQARELEWIRQGRWDFGSDYAAAYEALVVAKTAHYSFITPVVVGATIAELRGDARAQLAAYARHVGVAFQITDDLLNLRAAGESGAYGKESAGDLWEGKRTLILLHALHAASPAERAAALAILARPRPDPAALARAELIAELHAAGHLDAVARSRLLGEGGDTRFKTEAEVAALMDVIEAHGGLEFAAEVARAHGEQALALLGALEPWLEAGDGRDLLAALPRYVIERAR